MCSYINNALPLRYDKKEICLWKYPAMTKTAELLGHNDRVLHLAVSPDGTTLVR